MADPRVCCILGVCCPPNGTEQKEALASYLRDRVGPNSLPVEASHYYEIAGIVLDLYGAGPHRDRFNEIEPATLESPE